MVQTFKIFKVDSFVKNNTGGSPTGVVLNAAGLTDGQMQHISNLVGASHTAFVFEPLQPNDNISIRFFTPGGEILNCGHGTIAAHYTREKYFNYNSSRIIFQQAKEGLQEIQIIHESGQIEIYLQQNSIQFSIINSEIKSRLLTALAISENHLATEYPIIIASPGSNRFLVALRSTDILNKIAPDFEQLKNVSSEIKGIGCFAYSINNLQPPLYATARMFAPNIGVNEDVINGNSSGCLAAYLLQLSRERDLNMFVIQGQKFNREGVVIVKVKRGEKHFETVIGGTAVIRGEIQLL